MKKSIFARLALMLGCLGLVVGCQQKDQANFYVGQTVHIIVGFEAGGGYDAFARVVGRHLGKHIPGNPTVVVQNMPGAASITATNYVLSVGPQDGTQIGASGLAPLLIPLLDPSMAQLDPRKLNWLPSSGQGLSTVAVWHEVPVNTWEDVKTTPIKMSGAGATGQTTLFTRVINEVLGTKFQLIHGYQGSASELLAMERGEIAGQPGLMWSSLKTMRPEWVAEKKVKVLLQYGGTKPAPDLPGVPFVRDLIKDPKDLEMFDVATAPLQVVRPFFMGASVPADRVEIMRKAFMDTYMDPEFLADCEKLQIPIEPASAESVKMLVDNMYNAPADIVARLRKIYTQTD